MIAHVIGIDPGVVDTGCVSVLFDPQKKEIVVDHHVVKGLDAKAVAAWADDCYPQLPKSKHRRFIEGYRPRNNLAHDSQMANGVKDIRVATGGTVLNNTGIKTTVPTSVLLVLGLWKFSTPTNHDDLRSAARIAVLGMLKDEKLNELLADIVRDHLDGKSWAVTTR